MISLVTGGLHTTGTAGCPDLEGSKESSFSSWNIPFVTKAAYLPNYQLAALATFPPC